MAFCSGAAVVALVCACHGSGGKCVVDGFDNIYIHTYAQRMFAEKNEKENMCARNELFPIH